MAAKTTNSSSLPVIRPLPEIPHDIRVVEKKEEDEEPWVWPQSGNDDQLKSVVITNSNANTNNGANATAENVPSVLDDPTSISIAANAGAANETLAIIQETVHVSNEPTEEDFTDQPIAFSPSSHQNDHHLAAPSVVQSGNNNG